MSYGQYSTNSLGRQNPLASVPKPERQRQVFGNSEIPHLWAHQTQSSARNAYGNFYFTDAVIYSYGSHFPLAAHVKNGRGQSAVLFTTRGYSNTTSKHIGAVRDSIPSGTVRFDVALERSMLPHADGTIDPMNIGEIVAAYRDKIQARINRALAARMGTKIQAHLDSARLELAELLKFVAFFGLPQMSERARIASRKLPHIPATVEEAKELGKAGKQEKAREAKIERERRAAEYRARTDAWMVAHPDYASRWDGTDENAEALAVEFHQAEYKRQAEEKRAKDVAELADWMAEHTEESAKWDGSFENGSKLRHTFWNAERERKNAETLANWLNGQSASLGFLPYTHNALLRIVGGEVQTSRGARFPVSHARRGLALVRAVMARGEEWHTNGHTCHLGHYSVDRIAADGTVYAGCHVVPWSSIERIAPELDAMSAQTAEIA